MAWFDTNKNGGQKGGYGRFERGYGRNSYPDHVHAPMVVSEYHNAQRYEYQAEQVVELRRGAGLNPIEHNGNQRAKDGYKHQGMGNKTHLVPWKETRDWSDSGNESSPKAHNYGKAKGGSPRYKNPPQGFNSRPNAKPHRDHVGYDHSSSGDEDEDCDSDYEKDDVVCNDGVCYPNHNGARAKPNNHFIEDGYENPKSKPNYPAPHTVPLSAQPNRAPNPGYYENPNQNTHSPPIYENSNRNTHSPPIYENPNRNTHSPPIYENPNRNTRSPPIYENRNRNTHSPPLSGAAPAITAQEGKGAYYEYEQPPNRPFSRNPPQIKTKPEYTGRIQEQPNKNAKNRLPRDEGYKDTINSSEAKKRYGGATVPTEAQPKNNGTIDCKEAAKRYHGIFVPGNNV